MNILDKLGIDLSSADGVERGLLRGIITEYSKNVRKYNDPEVQQYFHTLIAAIMLEYHKAYETCDIKVPYRIKSPKSVLDKILDYMKRDDKSEFSYNADGEFQGKLKEELKDMFAITVVGCNRPSTFYSNDPEIIELIEEKKRNHSLLGELQKLRLKITKDEFSGTEEDAFNFNCSRKEYYMMSIMTIERIKTLIHPNAVNLIKKYDEQLEEIKKHVPPRFYDICVRRIREQNKAANLNTSEKLGEELKAMDVLFRYADFSEEEASYLEANMDEKDIKVCNFLKLADDFTARIHDKIDLAILTKQLQSVFDKSKTLKRFGVSIQKGNGKQKRTESGYVADFIYLTTPFGTIEMQVQTQHENQEGNYGYAAHSSLKGKKFKEFDLPALDDEQAMKDFRVCVDFITPKKFLAQYDHLESDRIIIQKFGDYQNYKALASQVKRGSEEDRRLQKYFANLYYRRNEYFPNEDKNEKIEGFIEYDIEEYLESPELKKILNNSEVKIKVDRLKDGEER